MAQKSDLVFQAKLAEQAERYEDMKKYMTTIATKHGVLEVEERNLLSVAYKNIVGARRAAWRVISSLLTTAGRTPMERKVLQEYKITVEKELDDLCDQILSMLKDTLIANSTGTEEKVFYLKMAGDYYRYLAEFKKDGATDSGTDGKAPDLLAADMYKEALAVAKDGFKSEDPLPKTNPILLGLTLNFSVFYYEILQKPDKACTLAKNGFDAAVDELDALEEESYKDATLIMQLLRDNLTLWTSSDDGDQYDNDDP
jgi:hypothetical protein